MLDDILFLCAELEHYPNFDVAKKAKTLKMKVEGFQNSSQNTKLSDNDKKKAVEYLMTQWTKEYNELMRYSTPIHSNLRN